MKRTEPHPIQSPEHEPKECLMCPELAEKDDYCLTCLIREEVPMSEHNAYKILEVLGLN